MTLNGWSLVRFVHVIAAMGWVGGQLLLSGMVLPVLRANLDSRARVPLIHAVARRFALTAKVGLLPLLLVSGVALAGHRAVTIRSLGQPGYGRLLGIKLVLVVASISLAATHGVLATRNARTARPLALGGLGVSMSIVVVATALVP